MSFKSVDVVMLSTNEKANLWLNHLTQGTLNLSNESMLFNTGQHLYFLSDEEIKEGDWYVNKHSQVLNYSIGQDLFHVKGKIIATTDKSLKWSDDNDIQIIDYHFAQLPHPSQQFIEKYIEAYNSGNPITKVMVEYDWIKTPDQIFYANNVPYGYDTLKVSKDNTITIRKMKDSWSREEVIKLINNRLNEEYKHGGRSGMLKCDHDKWIEENL